MVLEMRLFLSLILIPPYIKYGDKGTGEGNILV